MSVEQALEFAGIAGGPHNGAITPIGGTAMRGLRLAAEGPVTFCHDVGASYDDLGSIVGIERYSGRPLVATLPGDTIHLPDVLEADYRTALRHYRALGIACADTVAWNMSPKPTYQTEALSVFLFDETTHQVDPDATRLEAVNHYNDKNWFAQLARRQGYPMPPTDIYSQGETPVQSFAGPWFVKGAVAATGTRVVKCHNWDEVLAAAADMPGDYQVQKGLEKAIAFLNVQYEAKPDGTAGHVATTAQLLDGFTHDGNETTDHNPRALTDAVANEAAAAGLRGVFAFDVAVVSAPEEAGMPYHPHQLIECNPRPNGSTYFTAVAERLGVDEWAGVNMKTDLDLEGSLDALAESGLLFEDGAGLVVVNWGTAQDGKLGVFAAGPKHVRQAQIAAARQLLHANAKAVTQV